MNVCEQMVRFTHKNYTVRCWVPVDIGSKNFHHSVQAEKYKNHFSCFVLNDSDDYLTLAQYLCFRFDFNAVEVTDTETGYGGVFYREWP